MFIFVFVKSPLCNNKAAIDGREQKILQVKNLLKLPTQLPTVLGDLSRTLHYMANTLASQIPMAQLF